jgi:hypothetical protein
MTVTLPIIGGAGCAEIGPTDASTELTGPGRGPMMVTEHREELTLEAALEFVAERRRLAAGPSTDTQ